MRKTFRKGINLLKDFSEYFYKGWQAGLSIPYAKSFFSSLIIHVNRFRHQLYSGGIVLHTIKDEKLKKLQTTSNGLHSLLPPDSRLTYSILISVSQPNSAFFRTCLESALNQSAPNFEVLIGVTHSLNHENEKILTDFQHRYPSKIKVFDLTGGADQEIAIQKLSEKASGHFLLTLGEEDWIRPDFLFRYEQTLRIFPDPERTVLYCDLTQLSDRNSFIPSKEHKQPAELIFPYLFKQFIGKSLLVPAMLWKKLNAIHPFTKGAEDEELLLHLDLAGAKFQHVPFFLYSIRYSSKQKNPKSQQAFLQVLENYTLVKQLDWKWSRGYQSHTVRAIPSLKKEHVIHAIIPYKDQKELTIRSIHSLLKQKNVQVMITAVDNRSSDKSIAKEIEALGGEVIAVDEPFNYSRLNNLAVSQTQRAYHCDVLLFLNNDVELEPDALSEMLRWIYQPRIGMVGCRLNYPDGRLQHGGVRLDPLNRDVMRWEHIEKLKPFEELDESRTLGIFDAVTAACSMIKRQTFLDVGGFDEVWYPIGYSDTNLAIKLTAKGLKCFYTPYAVGIHHESVSRKSSIEDFENSYWLHALIIKERDVRN